MKLDKYQRQELEDNGLLSVVDKLFFINVKNNFQKLPDGTFSSCYTDFKDVYKKYFQNPYIYTYSNNPELLFDGDGVVKNFINMIGLKHEDVSFVDKFYVLNDQLVGYKSKFMKGEYLHEISDFLLEDLREVWVNAYELSHYFSENNIIPYDLNITNCTILDKKLKIFDTDFFYRDIFDVVIKNHNYKIINTLFMNFIETYFWIFDYSCKKDRYLELTTNYVDVAIEELLLVSSGNCKTLKDVANNLSLNV